MNKKTAVLLIVFLIAAGALTFLYFKWWHEPEAEYVATDNLKLIQVRNDMAELKADLKKKGLYDCCIHNDCNWCALYMGHCPCQKLISKKGDEKSCPECAAAWNKKLGKVPGRDPDAIGVTTFGIYGYEEEGHSHNGTGHQHY